MKIVLTVINIAGQLLAVLVVLYVVIQMIFPNAGGRGILARILDPLLNPIRKIVKPFKGFDFSPLILLVLILIVEILLTAILGSFIK
jgi:YggT family protein